MQHRLYGVYTIKLIDKQQN